MRTLIPLESRDLIELRCPWCGRTPPRGTAGYKAVRGGKTIGTAVIAPPVQGSDLCPPGSVVLTQLWVHPDDVFEHVGSQLVQRLCAHLVARDMRFLVAYGATGPVDCAHLAAGWLERAGFVEHAGGTQWRIDLRRTVPGLGLVRGAANGIIRTLGLGPDTPAPAGRG